MLPHQLSDITQLRKKAHEVRIQTLKMLAWAPSGHVGGALGMAEIFTALYWNVANINPLKPEAPERDYILLSNGHICPVWYAVLGMLEFYPAEEMNHLRKIDHLLQGHPKIGIPGVENSSGPLGHGLSQAVGIALGLRLDQKPNRVFCLMSDGEHQEGQTWEAVMAANKWKLDNLTAVMDYNWLQIEGTTEDIMPLGDLAAKYQNFGWHVLVIDGHDMSAIIEALETSKVHTGPTMIVAHTLLGKGVSFMENNWEYHDWKGKSEEADRGIQEIQQHISKL